jgi:hypothetical protein
MIVCLQNGLGVGRHVDSVSWQRVILEPAYNEQLQTQSTRGHVVLLRTNFNIPDCIGVRKLSRHSLLYGGQSLMANRTIQTKAVNSLDFSKQEADILDEIGGDRLAGSGFEAEEPEHDFDAPELDRSRR